MIVRKAQLVDPFSKGTHHEVINMTWLIMLSEIYDSVEYIGDSEYQDNMKSQLAGLGYSLDNVIYSPIKIHRFTKCGCLRYLLFLILVSLRDFYYWIKSPSNCDVFYINNIYFSLFLFCCFSYFKKNRVYVLCHSELEAIHLKWNNYIMFLYGCYIRMCFKTLKFNSNIHFILLGDRMRNYFVSYISQNNAKRFYSIDHPYIRPETKHKCSLSEYDTYLKIGIISVIKDGRGLNNLNKLLETKLPENIKLFAISKVVGVVEDPYKSLIQLNREDKLFSADIYTAYVKEMDFIIMLYDLDSYKLTASGSILEAIWNEKPIIALKNDYFDYLFAKYGEMGILCDSVEELCVKIGTLEYCKCELNIWYSTIAMCRQRLLPKNGIDKLIEIIN